MGQNQVKEKQNKKQRPLLFFNLSQLAFCCGRSEPFSNSKDTLINSEWKQATIDILDPLLSFEWSQILKKCLEDHDCGKIDMDYQKELRQAALSCANDIWYYNSNRKPSKNGKKRSVSSQSKDNKIPKQMCDSKTTLNNSLSSDDEDLTIKSLLESLCIPEDLYLDLNCKNNWFKRLFEVSSKMDLQARGNRVDMVQFARLNSSQISIDKHRDFFSNLASKQEDSKTKDCSKSIYSFLYFQDEGSVKSYGLGSAKNKDKPVIPSTAKEDISEKRYYKALRSFKILTNIIERHLKYGENIFHKLKEVFEKYFEREYGEAPNCLFQAQEYALKASEELQIFTIIMYTGITLFYRIDNLKAIINGAEMVFTEDNLMSFVSSIVFSNRIHATIFNLFQFLNIPTENAYIRALKQIPNLRPQDFGVADDYCLNERTIMLLREKKLLEKQIAQASMETFYFEADSPSEIKLEQKVEEGEKQIALESDPYYKAIIITKRLTQQPSPIQKFKSIIKALEMISLSIETFYMNLGVKEVRKIDPQQTVAILMYVLAKSQLSDVSVHCRIIKDFITKNVLNSVSGYYTSLVEEAVNRICGINKDEMFSDGSNAQSEEDD